jgi:heme/copper-type cytochrome/quinol oxidase subunit 2
MPIVVDVRTPDDFKKWVEAQKAAMKQAGARDTAAPTSAPPDGRPRDAAAPASAQILPHQY